jgi:hypothetical protein
MLNEDYLYVCFKLQILHIARHVAHALTDQHALHTPVMYVINT